MRTVAFSEAKASLDSLIDEVVARRQPLMIDCGNDEAVVLVGESHWAAIEKILGPATACERG